VSRRDTELGVNLGVRPPVTNRSIGSLTCEPSLIRREISTAPSTDLSFETQAEQRERLR
jgi:hypothetical protein